MNAPGLSIHVPSLSWDGNILFDDFRLALEAGRWTCLLGPSGVGKTTLLRLVAGLDPAASLPPPVITASDGLSLAGRVAYMAQSDLLLPWLSVLDNVLIGLRLAGRSAGPGERDRARALLERVGIGERAGDRPGALSGGMRQRVALARTLMLDRPIVAMDEPFSALDAITRFRLQDLAAELLADRTVLMVTHDPGEAVRIGHRILVLAGRPVRLQAEIVPLLPPPRPPSDPEGPRLQAALLASLAAS